MDIRGGWKVVNKPDRDFKGEASSRAGQILNHPADARYRAGELRITQLVCCIALAVVMGIAVGRAVGEHDGRHVDQSYGVRHSDIRY